MAIISFLIFTIAVGMISWYMTRNEDLSSVDGYFRGGRHLGWFLVGGSLFLSNISAASLVGEAEAVYLFNMSVMMWGFSSIVAMVLVSEFVLPIYLRIGATTTPEFLGLRFDNNLKTWVAALLVIGYCINLMPPVLYTGAVVFNGMFDISGQLGISDWSAIWLLVWAIGIVGSLYAVFGGLKAIAASDAINGVGLVIGGLLVPFFGMTYLGNGDFGTGVDLILSQNKSHLNALGSHGDPVPWPTLFTGMLLVNLNYWGTEQYIIQRSVSAKNLAEGQKGFIFGMGLKFIAPLITCVPGLIALILITDIANTAEVYPAVLAKVMPTYILGFIAAVVFGASLTTFNSGLNSTSTMAMLDIYKPHKQKRGVEVSDLNLIRLSKRFQVVVAIAAMLIAPLIALADGGFYNYLQKVAGFFSVPIFTIVFVGFMTKRVPAVAAKVALVYYLLCYGYTQLINDFGFHFLHVMAFLFVTSSAIMIIIGKAKPQEVPFEMPKSGPVNMQAWKPRWVFYIGMMLSMVGVTLWLSPFGIAEW